MAPLDAFLMAKPVAVLGWSALDGVDGALAACRFCQDAALLLLWGSSGFRAACVPRRLAMRLADRLRWWDRALVLVAVLACLVKLPATAASIGDGWRHALDPVLVGRVLSATSAGRAWMVQAAACLLLVGATLSRPGARPVAHARPACVGDGMTHVRAAAAGLALAGLALTGHAVMQEGAAGVLHEAVAVVHVLAGGAWLGALLPVLAILGALARDGQAAEATQALRRFSRAGHVAVALVLATGVANTALVLGHWPTAFDVPYEALLSTKIVVVALMAALALVNRYVLVPRIARPGGLAALRAGTLAELPLGLAAIALVSVFGLTDPR